MRGKCMLLVIAALLAGLTFHLSPAPVARANPGVLYVKPSVSGSGNCSNWANACTLQTALTNASSGDEIWVAQGTYKPGITRVSTFQLKNDVALYGGFAGDETSRDQRNWEANVTTLSGDIGTVGDASDNCYTVVFADGTNNAAVLDGFTITDGNANGSDGLGWSEAFGGGIYNLLAHPTVYNCIFRNNLSIWDGAGMYNNNSNPTLTNVMFYNNATAVDRVGGGMANFRSSPTLINCVFRDNSAESGAGLNNHAYSSPTLTNCSFSGNSATGRSGGISNSTESNPTLTNCIL